MLIKNIFSASYSDLHNRSSGIPFYPIFKMYSQIVSVCQYHPIIRHQNTEQIELIQIYIVFQECFGFPLLFLQLPYILFHIVHQTFQRPFCYKNRLPGDARSIQSIQEQRLQTICVVREKSHAKRGTLRCGPINAIHIHSWREALTRFQYYFSGLTESVPVHIGAKRPYQE